MNIKKIAASFLAAAMLMTSGVVNVPASAVSVTDGIFDEETNLFYEPLKDGTLRVTTFDRGKEPTGDVVIPETYDGKTVSEVENILTDCRNVTSVTIPKTITRISLTSFTSRSGLENIIVSEDNPNFSSENGILFNKEKTEIIYYPRGKTDKSYTIPSTVDIIGRSSFEMSELESIIIPDSVSVIGLEAFGFCDELAALNIPKGVEKMSGPLASYSGIAEFTVASNNEFFRSIDGVIFSKDSKVLVSYPAGNKAEEYSIPEGTEVLGEYSLSRNINLKKVNIPESVLTIERNAFDRCECLLEIEIPYKVKKLKDTFNGCGDLESVKLPLGIEEIGAGTFKNCDSLKTINFNGTKADWDMIAIASIDNTAMNNATIYFSDGTVMDGAGIVEADQAPKTTTNADGSQEFTPGVEKKGALSNADFETMKQIKASASEGTFKEEVTMNISRDTASLGGSSFAVNIRFINANGDEIQPVKEVTVKIPVPARLQNAEKIFVYHINSEKKPEKIETDTEIIDGVTYVVFKTAHFSTYELTDTEVETGSGDDNTGDTDNTDDTNTDSDNTGSTDDSSSTGDTSSSEPANSDTASGELVSSNIPGYIESATNEPTSSTADPTTPDSNPATGVAASILPIVAAISAVVVIKKKK